MSEIIKVDFKKKLELHSLDDLIGFLEEIREENGGELPFEFIAHKDGEVDTYLLNEVQFVGHGDLESFLGVLE